MRKILLFLLISSLALFFFTGCEGLFPSGGELAGTQWRLSAWSDSSLDLSPFYITANFDESHISGTSAINSYSGSYLAAANHVFSIGELQMTLMGGSEEAMRAESLYFELLGQACMFTLDQTTLTLLDAFNDELLIFSKTVPIVGLATVEEIDILIAESFPVQVFVVAKGYLPNPCTEIYQIIQEREGNAFFITIKTYRSPGFCIQVLAPFEEIIPLEVYGLPAGTYTVEVNGVQGTFNLEINNILSLQ